ncbi:MAG TPA: hypothetical protein VFA92_09335 [Candidatus Binatia bacterium]|nr:hypothetical protein [Candidatus Binatia bacterium]
MTAPAPPGIVLDRERIVAALNDDPEFRLMARRWDCRLLVRMGDQPYLIEIRDGEVRRLTNRVTIFDASDIQIGGPHEGWLELLKEVPGPLYQDLFPAVLHKGFTMTGDLESLFAYYPAVRRMWDVIRRVRAEGEGSR